MAKPIIVFDFDGTLADSAPIIRKIYEGMAEENNWSTLDDKTYEKLRHGTLSQARRWAGIKWWQLPRVMDGAQKLFSLESAQVKLFPGIKELIRDIQKLNLPIYILSRNTPELIDKVLKRNKINGIIVLGKVSIFGKHRALREIARNEKAERKNVFMIGDEIRDINSANKADVTSIAVAWGLQDISLLKKHSPTYVVNKPDEIFKIIKQSLKN